RSVVSRVRSLRDRDRTPFGQDPFRHDPDAARARRRDRPFTGAVSDPARFVGRLSSVMRPYTRGMSSFTATAQDTAIQRVAVDLGERSHDVVIGQAVLGDLSAWQSTLPAGAAMVVTNTTVAALYLKPLDQMLRGHHARVHSVVLPDGEQHKDWTTLTTIFDALLQAHCDRDTTIYALGGGVVGDMAGFAAACFMRGVPYVERPTTLLARVEFSVG